MNIVPCPLDIGIKWSALRVNYDITNPIKLDPIKLQLLFPHIWVTKLSALQVDYDEMWSSLNVNCRSFEMTIYFTNTLRQAM